MVVSSGACDGVDDSDVHGGGSSSLSGSSGLCDAGSGSRVALVAAVVLTAGSAEAVSSV